MTAWAYTLIHDEAILLPYWIRAYGAWCDRLTVYVDVDTRDLSREIASGMGAEVRTYDGANDLDDLAFIEFAQGAYKEARGRADWVVWTDVDEIIYHPHLEQRLGEHLIAGVGVPLTVGYAMLGDAPPTGPGQIYDEIKRGVPAPEYAKLAVFDPWLDVQWTPGKHSGIVGGQCQIDDGHDPLYCLHFRWLGQQWFVQRNARNYARVDSRNRERRHGIETYPGYTGKFSADWFTAQLALAKDVV